MTRFRTGLMALAALLLASCATQSVPPWQRGELARPGMAFESDPLTAAYRAHAQVSKEAASGGAALAGGGCGCN